MRPGSKGRRIPVAILTSEQFDAQSVIEETVRFGEAPPARSGRLVDADGDGDLDLLLRFRTGETGIQCGDTTVTLTGETSDGIEFQGSDFITTVRCGGTKGN